jgi:hypothetical protein
MMTQEETSKGVHLSATEITDIIESVDFIDTMHIIGRLPPTESDIIAYNTITPEQYEEFEQYLAWDLLSGMRFGQAFCERFGISNASPLYHFRGREVSERWIRDNYLVKK